MKAIDLIKEFLIENGYEAEIIAEGRLEIQYPMNDDKSIYLIGDLEVEDNNSDAPSIYHRPTDTTISIAHPEAIETLMETLRGYEGIRKMDAKLVEKWGINKIVDDTVIETRKYKYKSNEMVEEIAKLMEIKEDKKGKPNQ